MGVGLAGLLFGLGGLVLAPAALCLLLAPMAWTAGTFDRAMLPPLIASLSLAAAAGAFALASWDALDPGQSPFTAAITFAAPFGGLSLAVTSISAGIVFALSLLCRHLRTTPQGRCPGCGYELMGLPPRSPCPDCGAECRR